MSGPKSAANVAKLHRETEDESTAGLELFPETSESLSPKELERLLAELRVRQIQLELQNEELRQAQAKLEASKEHYFDLYDLAPVGYCTANEQGLIQESNLTTCSLLGVTRQALIMSPLSRFIAAEDQDQFYFCRRQLFKSGDPQSCRVRLRRADQTTVKVQLDACLTRAPKNALLLQRIVITDITKDRQPAKNTN